MLAASLHAAHLRTKTKPAANLSEYREPASAYRSNVSRGAGTLEEQHAAAEQAKANREKMLKKLKNYESKILQSEKQGGKSLVEIAKEKELRLKQQRDELEKRYASSTSENGCGQ